MVQPILLYDGVCALCNRFVEFILRRDYDAIFRFASLQSALAGRILGRHGTKPTDMDTVYVVIDHELADERLLSRSDALIFVLKHLGEAGCDRRKGGAEASAPVSTTVFARSWKVVAFLLELMPKSLRDAIYNFVARRRYGIFGRSEICALPRDQDHSRFLDS
jgi:predicted DCC family thiol-disulfide oxidoreductase YuxK